MESLENYRSLLTKRFKKADVKKLLAFGLGIGQRLFDQYHLELVPHGFQQEGELLQENKSFLLGIVNHHNDYTDDMLESRLTQLYIAGYETTADLDLSEVYKLGIYKLINSFQFCFAYLLDKKYKHIVECACCPMKIITLMLVKEGLDMSLPEQHFDHPMYQQEIDFQLSLLHDLDLL